MPTIRISGDCGGDFKISFFSGDFSITMKPSPLALGLLTSRTDENLLPLEGAKSDESDFSGKFYSEVISTLIFLIAMFCGCAMFGSKERRSYVYTTKRTYRLYPVSSCNRGVGRQSSCFHANPSDHWTFPVATL